jgi:uncharacterized membrane protein YjfL (UPF0719 family)
LTEQGINKYIFWILKNMVIQIIKYKCIKCFTIMVKNLPNDKKAVLNDG